MKHSRTVNQDAYTKFTQSSILDFAPETLASFKQAFDSGRYDQVNRLYSAMYHEWDTLQKDVNKITSSLATLDFKAVAAAPDGGEPGPLAKEVAELVNTALWHNDGIGAGEWKHGFTQLIGSIYHALCRGVDVHEIIWGYDGKIYYPKEYLPVLPCYYAWANSSGEDDRLMLYPEGFDMSGGQAFPPNKFIVALNTQGPDHPMYNATFRALVPWFGAAVWGPRWLAEYCQVFGLPFRVFHVHNDQEREQLEQQIQETPIFTNLVLKPEDTVDIAQPASGTGLPQQALIDLAEKACHKLILGQTLTSDTSRDGGSRAQAQVHAGVETSEIMAVGDYVAGVLNAQLVPAIVRMNYGATPVPMPEMRCSLPTAQATKDTVDLFDGMINRLGMTIRRSDVYDRLGMQIPAPGDDVLGPAYIPAKGRDDISAAAAARYPRRGFDRIQELGNDAERLAIAAFAAASKPVRDRMRQLVEQGATPQEMLAALDTMAVDPQPLADAHMATIRAGLGLPDVKKNAQSVAAAANDPQQRREIAKKAADARWAGHKGTSREHRAKARDKRFTIEKSLSDHEKVTKLADLITKASADGARLVVGIPGAAWGDTLILASGREAPQQKAGAHGVKHSLESRHHISAKEIADTLLHGATYTGREHPEHRTDVYKYPYLVVLEREINMGSRRISNVTVKLHTAMKQYNYLDERVNKRKGGA